MIGALFHYYFLYRRSGIPPVRAIKKSYREWQRQGGKRGPQ